MTEQQPYVTLNFDAAATERYLQSGDWTADTVASLLEQWSSATPERSAIVGPQGTLSFRETFQRARRLAGALSALGVGKGDVVAIQLPNQIEFVLTYYAVTMIGAVLGTLHMPLRRGELQPMLTHTRARVVICAAASESYDAPAEMLHLAAAGKLIEHVLVVGGQAPPGTSALADCIEHGEFPIDIPPPLASDPALLCFTSGTSTTPKAVVHNHHTMLSNNRLCAGIYGITAEDRVLSGPPFTHAFGVCVINFTLSAGATNVLMPAFSPPLLAAAIEELRPDLLFVVPAHVAACLSAGVFNGRDLSSVRHVTISGAPCPYQVAHDFDALLDNGAVGQMWGMSETYMGLHTPFDAPAEVRLGTLGPATPAVANRIMLSDDTVAAAGEEGEIHVQGCSVIPEYFGNADANAAAFTADGWFRTGDLAVCDERGYVRITGRVKDIVNRGGIKFNPADVEVLLTDHPGIRDAAIIPMPDAILGEKACLFAVCNDGAILSLDDVCRFLADHDVAKIKWPERLVLIETIPMTPTRKVSKAALAKLL